MKKNAFVQLTDNTKEGAENIEKFKQVEGMHQQRQISKEQSTYLIFRIWARCSFKLICIE